MFPIPITISALVNSIIFMTWVGRACSWLQTLDLNSVDRKSIPSQVCAETLKL